jgi:hydroxymethylglutaryl-CoA reductase (NADPH)
MSGQVSSESSLKIPRDKDDDYRESVAATRRRFVTERTGARLDHVAQYSIDPSILPGNVENFFGVAQLPKPNTPDRRPVRQC